MSKVFYKAVRCDGTDFYTGEVRYELGKRIRPLPHNGERQICGPGLLHAATVPTETLVGGSWPCRLFRVEGKPVAGLDDRHPHKAGFRQLTVVEELPAHGVFGPQGEEVVAIIDRASRLIWDEARRLAAARDAARDAAGAAAWYAAGAAAWDAARYAAWDAARYAARAAAATLTRDLIGQGGYTQEHYDLLMKPWREVIEGGSDG